MARLPSNYNNSCYNNNKNNNIMGNSRSTAGRVNGVNSVSNDLGEKLPVSIFIGAVTVRP
jgi:hypothetical protein